MPSLQVYLSNSRARADTTHLWVWIGTSALSPLFAILASLVTDGCREHPRKAFVNPNRDWTSLRGRPAASVCGPSVPTSSENQSVYPSRLNHRTWHYCWKWKLAPAVAWSPRVLFATLPAPSLTRGSLGSHACLKLRGCALGALSRRFDRSVCLRYRVVRFSSASFHSKSYRWSQLSWIE